ncbi:MAG: DNA recombination protein RmuC, partial [Holosporales bacterium]|nr:DNA recombination protein RmuC [Holosporales bacterium]
MLPIQVLLIVALSVICVLLLVLLIRKKKSTCNQDELSENFQNLAELINGIHKKITEVEKIEHIIQSDTNSLSKILSNSNMSGKWGEMYLKKVVETSGMTPYCDFIEQEQSENSPKRPDMVIKLPGNRCVIVDSKAPINTYAKAVNSEDKDMKEYVKSLKGHIKDLSQKSYWKEYDYNTPEFVVMFLPVESLLSDILKEDSELIEHGIRQNVLIATPINFIA